MEVEPTDFLEKFQPKLFNELNTNRSINYQNNGNYVNKYIHVKINWAMNFK